MARKYVAVENVWKNLGESVWERCEKVFREMWKRKFYTKMGADVEDFHFGVEKFYRGYYTWLNRGREGFCTVSTAPTITTTIYFN